MRRMSIEGNESDFLEEVRSYFNKKRLENILKRDIREAIRHISLKDYRKRLSTPGNTTYQKLSREDYLFYDKSAIAIKKKIIRLQIRDRLTGQVDCIYQIYGQMPDIALAPLQPQKETSEHMCYICKYLEKNKFIACWIEELRRYYEENMERYLKNRDAESIEYCTSSYL